MKLKLAFFGTPSFSGDLLEKIITDDSIPVEVSFVMTQPDQTVGRKKIPTPSPVKQIAQKHNIKVIDSLSTLTTNYQLLTTIDIALVYAYAELIPKDLLQAPRFGFWNIHPSLLPKYRGASPMLYSLILGDTKTGVSLMQMVEKMDAGPIIDQVEYEIQPNDRRTDLEKNLTELGFELFKENLTHVIPTKAGIYLNRSPIESEMTKIKSQNDNDASYTRRITRQDGFVPLAILKMGLQGKLISRSAFPPLVRDYLTKYPIFNFQFSIFNFWRGLAPWPGIWTLVSINGVEKRLKITGMNLEKIHVSGLRFHVTRVQLEGKTEVSFEEFNSYYKIFK